MEAKRDDECEEEREKSGEGEERRGGRRSDRVRWARMSMMVMLERKERKV